MLGRQWTRIHKVLAGSLPDGCGVIVSVPAVAMSQHKRRFETLEDRQLLTALAAVQMPTAIAAEIASGERAATSNMPAGAADSKQPAADDDSLDNPNEYAGDSPPPASPAKVAESTVYRAVENASPPSSLSAYAYTSRTEGDRYARTYSTDTASSEKPPLSVDASDLSASVVSVSQPLNPASGQGAAASSFAAVFLEAGSTPAANGSPPVARSPSNGPLTPDPENRTGIAEPLAIANADEVNTLAAPVAELDLPGWEHLLTDNGLTNNGATSEPFVRAAKLPSAEMAVRPLLAGPAGASLATLEKRVDAFFERLDQLGGGLAEQGQVSRIGQWLVIAGGACAAFEYARARYREGGTWQAPSISPNFYEPCLRRRWFGRGRNGP